MVGNEIRALAVAALALLLILSGCAGTSSRGLATPVSPSVSLTPYESPVYTYEVEGVATDATVTFATPTGQEQHSIEDLELDANDDQRWEFEGPMPFLYVSIQGGTAATAVTCRILMDDKVLSENFSSADYGIATCQVA